MAKKVHKIYWHSWKLTDAGMPMFTGCGEAFWKTRRGTTEDAGVTCKRCLATMKKGKK